MEVTYFTIDEVLDYLEQEYNLRVSKPTWRRYVRDGYAPKPVRVGRRHLRWRQADADKWVAMLDEAATSEPQEV